VKFFDDFRPLALATAAILIIAVFASALVSFGFYCGYRYAEATTMAAVYRAQLDRTQELMRSDFAIVNSYKDGLAKARR
jgi:hypothetical protein